MSNFEFQEAGESYKSREIIGQPQVPGLANRMVKAKLAKDVPQACKMMIFFSVALILVSIAIVVFFMGPEHAPIYQ